MARREHWWSLGEAEAVAVYRARLMLPLLVLWGATALPFILFADMRQPEAATFLASVWVALLLPILIRRRRAAIFTSDTFMFRPALGRLSRVPLNGIKRAYLLEPEPGDEYHVPSVRLELLIGGNMDVHCPAPSFESPRFHNGFSENFPRGRDDFLGDGPKRNSYFGRESDPRYSSSHVSTLDPNA